jgi:hypothetical protein
VDGKIASVRPGYGSFPRTFSLSKKCVVDEKLFICRLSVCLRTPQNVQLVDEKLFIGVLARLDRNQQGAHMDAKCQYSSIPPYRPIY